jgi:enoyl-CoA hydratase/carnithine racemase
MSDHIEVSKDGFIATVALNRPDCLNAINLAMWEKLGDTFTDLSEDSSIRCIVLRGATEKAFAAGADIAEFASARSEPSEAQAYDEIYRYALLAVKNCVHPVVAFIQGPCIGGALEMAAFADIRITSDTGRFGVPIKRIGLVMSHPEISGLIDLVGPARTKEILLEGRVVKADEALQMGLVNRVYPDSYAEEEAYACARRIAEGAPLTAQWHKAFVARVMEGTPLDALDHQKSYDYMLTDDFKEGVASFLEKRTPVFTGEPPTITPDKIPTPPLEYAVETPVLWWPAHESDDDEDDIWAAYVGSDIWTIERIDEINGFDLFAGERFVGEVNFPPKNWFIAQEHPYIQLPVVFSETNDPDLPFSAEVGEDVWLIEQNEDSALHTYTLWINDNPIMDFSTCPDSWEMP